MHRYIVGIAIGIFLAQNYDIPNLKQQMKGLQKFIQQYEKEK
jgi:hypothetical protein